MGMDATSGWADAALAGFRAMGASDYAAAAAHWLDARDALASADPHDPRRAAGQANAGAAHILLRQGLDAEAALADAEQRWMRLLSAIATADIVISGRSSAFHFTLASQNLQAFQNAQRRRLTRLCEAGLAITRFNRLLASAGPAASEAVVPSLVAQLSDILGSQSPEVRLLLVSSSETEQADSPYADKAAAFDMRHAPAAEVPADPWLRLEGAVALTALLRPGLHSGTSAALQDASDVRPAFPAAAQSSSTR
jgi:hypothetical protein